MSKDISTNNLAVNSDYTFHLIDPKQKTMEWALEFIKFRYPQLTSFFATPYWDGREDFATIRAYGQGNQPQSIYKKMFSPEGYMASQAGGKGNTDWTGMRWNIVSPVPKYKNIVSAQMEKAVPTEITCSATDELAKNKREEDKLKLKFQQIIDKDLAEMSAKMKLQSPMKSNMAKDIPTTNQGEGLSEFKDMDFDFSSDIELQMYMDTYYKNNVELANEMCINTLFQLNEFNEIKKELINDALDFGVAALRIYMDNNTCMPKMEWLKIDQVLVGVGRRRDFKDSDCWAYPDMMSVNQIIGKFGKELTLDDVKEIFKYGVTTSGYFNGTSYDKQWNNGGQWSDKITRIDLDRVKVQVAYIAFKSQNCETTEYSKGKYDSTKVKDREYGYKAKDEKKSTIEQRWAQVVYKGYYVVGLDKLYDYGMLHNMVREEGKEEQVMMDLQIYRFAEKSFTEHMITHADGIELAYLKLQAELLMSIPTGYAIDVDRLAEVSMGDSGKLDQLQVLQMYKNTGTYVYKSVDEDGNPLAGAMSGTKPIDRLPNGVSEAINGYIMAIQMHIQQIEAQIGYNPVTAGAAPEARASATGQRIAAAAADNATYYLYSGLKTMVENSARYMGSMVQDMSEYGGEGFEALKRMIGQTNAAIIESMDSIPLHRFGVFIEDKMSDDQEEQFRNLIMAAYQKSEIDLSDLISVWYLKNVKQAIALFNLKRRKQMAKNAQMAQQDFELRKQEMLSQQQLTMALKQMEYQTSSQNTQMKVQGLLQQEQIKNQGKVATQDISGQQKSGHIAQQGQTDLLKEAMKQKAAA